MAGINEAVIESVNALKVEVSALRLLVEEVKKQSDHHDKILVRGYEDHLPLAEIVRNLTKTVSDYIAQKDKEEQRRKDDWNKLKWIIIGVIVPGVIIFLGQAVVFYFKVLPVLAEFSGT